MTQSSRLVLDESFQKRDFIFLQNVGQKTRLHFSLKRRAQTRVKLFPNFTRHHLITNTNCRFSQKNCEKFIIYFTSIISLFLYMASTNQSARISINTWVTILKKKCNVSHMLNKMKSKTHYYYTLRVEPFSYIQETARVADIRVGLFLLL